MRASPLERLTHLAGLYRLVLEPGQETNPEIRLRLQHLHQWGATTTHPVILRILRARADQLASEQETAQALLILESYLVRRLLSGRASTGLNRTLRSLVSAITDEEPVDVQISRYLSSRNRHFVDDAALRTAIHANPFYRSGRAQQRKVFLRWLEEAFGSREPIDTSTLSIEHVMPQNLSPAWRQHLEDTHPGQDIDELHDSLVHTLGNLTLTGYNSALSNRDFGWKRAEMLKSGLRLSASVTEQDHWGPQKIRDRADLLADLIIATWPGPMNTTHVVILLVPGIRQALELLDNFIISSFPGLCMSHEIMDFLPAVQAQNHVSHLLVAEIDDFIIDQQSVCGEGKIKFLVVFL